MSQSHDSIEVLQVLHHGSKAGLSKGIIDVVAPRLAVISVGAGINALRTDKSGDIEIISGKSFHGSIDIDLLAMLLPRVAGGDSE